MIAGGSQRVNIPHHSNRSKSMNIFKTTTRREQSTPCDLVATQRHVFTFHYQSILNREYFNHEYTDKRHQ